LVLFFPPIGERKQGAKKMMFFVLLPCSNQPLALAFPMNFAALLAVVNHVRLTVHVESRSYLAVEAAKKCKQKVFTIF